MLLDDFRGSKVPESRLRPLRISGLVGPWMRWILAHGKPRVLREERSLGDTDKSLFVVKEAQGRKK